MQDVSENMAPLLNALKVVSIYLFWVILTVGGGYYFMSDAVAGIQSGVTRVPIRFFRQHEALQWRDGQFFWLCIILKIGVAVLLIAWAFLTLRNMTAHIREHFRHTNEL